MKNCSTKTNSTEYPMGWKYLTKPIGTSSQMKEFSAHEWKWSIQFFNVIIHIQWSRLIWWMRIRCLKWTWCYNASIWRRNPWRIAIHQTTRTRSALLIIFFCFFWNKIEKKRIPGKNLHQICEYQSDPGFESDPLNHQSISHNHQSILITDNSGLATFRLLKQLPTP